MDTIYDVRMVSYLKEQDKFSLDELKSILNYTSTHIGIREKQDQIKTLQQQLNVILSEYGDE